MRKDPTVSVHKFFTNIPLTSNFPSGFSLLWGRRNHTAIFPPTKFTFDVTFDTTNDNCRLWWLNRYGADRYGTDACPRSFTRKLVKSCTLSGSYPVALESSRGRKYFSTGIFITHNFPPLFPSSVFYGSSVKTERRRRRRSVA